MQTHSTVALIIPPVYTGHGDIVAPMGSKVQPKLTYGWVITLFSVISVSDHWVVAATNLVFITLTR